MTTAETKGPHNKVTLRVKIKRNSDGEVRERTHASGDVGAFIFSWSENNFACDCNRSLEFHNYDTSEERPCGSTEFSVISITDESGKILYTEEE